MDFFNNLSGSRRHACVAGARAGRRNATLSQAATMTRMAVVSVDRASAENQCAHAKGARTANKPTPIEMRQRRSAAVVGHPLEEQIAEEVDRRTTEDDDDPRIRRMLGMRQHELIGHGADNDASNDGKMKVGVRKTRLTTGSLA